MKTRRLACLALATFLLLSLAGGCPFRDPRLTNQGGGNLITFALRFADGRLTTATPDEWQVFFDRVSDASDAIEIDLSDDEAAAIDDFVEANDLDTFDEIRQLVRQAEQEPDAADVVVPESLQELIDSGVDVESILET